MNINVSYDFDWGRRLRWLAELMTKNPDKAVRKLQWEALKYYPLASKEGIRGWMTMRIAFLAADILNKSNEEVAYRQQSNEEVA